MKLSGYSLVFSLVGQFLAFMIFPPLNLDFLGPYTLIWVPIGMLLSMIGMGLALYAFVKKEVSFMKYVALIPLGLGFVLIAFLSQVFSGEI